MYEKKITECGHDIPTLLTLDDSGAKYTYTDHISSMYMKIRSSKFCLMS